MKLKLENVCVSLAGKEILKNISFCAPEGSFTSVLGPSGCGKSTLLKTISGLLPCRLGSVFLDGRNAERIPPHKRKAVIVFQDIRLFPHMNVLENICFSMKMKGIPAERRMGKADELLRRVKLDGLGKMNPEKLSGGQRQRVALARALAAEPEILLLDEPFSGLDENLRFDMRLLVMDIHKEYRMTTIMVTHDREEALSMSDFILVMDEGAILQSGTPREVYEQPNSLKVAEYFGDAAFIRGTVSHGMFTSHELSVPCCLDCGEYVMMARQNALSISKSGVAGGFTLLEEIYAGKRSEWLIGHTVTGRILRCGGGYDGVINIGDNISVNLDVSKLTFFRPD